MSSCLPAAYLLAAGGGCSSCCLPAGCMGGRDRLHKRLPAFLLAGCRGGCSSCCLPAACLLAGCRGGLQQLLPACWLRGGEGQVA